MFPDFQTWQYFLRKKTNKLYLSTYIFECNFWAKSTQSKVSWWHPSEHWMRVEPPLVDRERGREIERRWLRIHLLGSSEDVLERLNAGLLVLVHAEVFPPGCACTRPSACPAGRWGGCRGICSASGWCSWRRRRRHCCRRPCTPGWGRGAAGRHIDGDYPIIFRLPQRCPGALPADRRLGRTHRVHRHLVDVGQAGTWGYPAVLGTALCPIVSAEDFTQVRHTHPESEAGHQRSTEPEIGEAAEVEGGYSTADGVER